MQIINDGEQGGKKVIQIYIETDKETQPKVMNGTKEIVLLIGLPNETEQEPKTKEKITNEIKTKMYKMLDDNTSVNEISKTLNVSTRTIYNHIDKRKTQNELQQKLKN